MLRTIGGARFLYARGQLHLADDRVLAALGDLQACGRLLADQDMDRPSIVPWRGDLAQAYLRIGKRRTARSMITDQLEQGDLGPRARGMSLRTLAAATELRQRSALLREAIVALQSSGDRYELAKALLDLSHVHHELGEFSRARMAAHRAGQEATACHATAVAAEAALIAEDENSDLPEQPAGVQLLSDAERRVATLAALGHTNREIGQRLFITPSTVEQHLTRVYRKLNVSSRKNLPHELPRAASGDLARADALAN